MTETGHASAPFLGSVPVGGEMTRRQAKSGFRLKADLAQCVNSTGRSNNRPVAASGIRPHLMGIGKTV